MRTVRNCNALSSAPEMRVYMYVTSFLDATLFISTFICKGDAIQLILKYSS